MKKKIDYSITPVYFYRFVCNDPNIINTYVGSTIDLTDRKTNHKSKCNNPNDKQHHLLVYKTIRENGGWDNWRMLEIENKIVKDKTEAKQQEQYWIEYYNAQMNTFKSIPMNIPEYNREYHRKHYEQLNAYQREYSEKNRDKITAYHRKHYEQNREKLNAQKREYSDKNRDKITAYQREYYFRKKEQKLMSLEDINIL